MTEELEAEIKEYDESMVQCIARDYSDTIDLRSRSMFQPQPDGTVHVTIPPVRFIKTDDKIIMDNPLRGI